MNFATTLYEFVAGRRQKPEQRSITDLPFNYGGSRYEYGMSEQRALSLAPLFAAVRHITDLASTLPLKAYRDLGESREPITLPKLFNDLYREGKLVGWLCQAFGSLVTQGNTVGYIVSRDGFGFPTQIVWLPMNRVGVREDGPVPLWYVDGRPVDRTEIVHIPWIQMPGRVLGLSPIEYYRVTIGAGLETWQYGADWFKAGGIPPGTFRNTQKTITPDAAKTIRTRLTESIRGHEPLVYGSDWEFNPIAIPPEQAQFIETQKMTANQIAALYGLNAVEIGGEPPNGLTYSNEARRAMQRLSNLQPYLTRFERAFEALLPERQYVKFHGDAIVRADIETRWEVYKTGRLIGAMNVDEIRAFEDQTPLPDGQGQDYTPLSLPGGGVAANPAGKPKTALPEEPEENPANRASESTPHGRVIDLLASKHNPTTREYDHG
jgi:HK97 family phage portal protein